MAKVVFEQTMLDKSCYAILSIGHEIECKEGQAYNGPRSGKGPMAGLPWRKSIYTVSGVLAPLKRTF